MFCIKEVDLFVLFCCNWVNNPGSEKEQLLLNDNNLVIRNMRANDMVPYKTSQDTIHIVTISEQYRPDVIANNAYGDPNLAWVILSANGLSDIFDLVAEMEIRIPSSLSIYNMGGVLNR